MKKNDFENFTKQRKWYELRAGGVKLNDRVLFFLYFYGRMAEDRIPSLDGWRGVSIIFLVLGHQMNLSRQHFAHNPKILNLLEFHNYAVQIFFVLSGFLITKLFISEERKYGDINLYNFYIRRIFRIIPAYYIFLTVVLIADRLSPHPGISWHVWLKAYLFLMNFGFWGTAWYVGHSWSLSVEEQYYLIWPAVYKRKRLLWIAIVFVCIAPVFRIISYRYPNLIYNFSFLVNADAIFWGALFAMYFDKPIFGKLLKYAKWIFAITLLLLIPERFSVPGTGIFTVPLVKTFFSLSLIILMHYSLNKESRMYAFFNNRFLLFLGVLSYSIYLWQQVFYASYSIFGDSIVTTFPINWIVIFLVAYINHRFIEKPFIGLRKRFMRKQVPLQQTAADSAAEVQAG